MSVGTIEASGGATGTDGGTTGSVAVPQEVLVALQKWVATPQEKVGA